MAVTHATTTAEPNDPDYDISANAWNAGHAVADGSFVAAKLSATATDKVFGRSTAGAGNGEEIPLTAAGRALIDDADAAAQRTTLGIAAAITGTKLDDLTAPDDNTDLNASTSAHGLMPKGTGSTTTFFRSDMTQATPAGGGLSSGTSFPGSPTTNDLFYRTDRALLYFWDGTRWLTTTLYTVTFPPTTAFATFTATANIGRLVPPFIGVYTLYLDSFDFFFNPIGAQSGTNYFNVLINWADQADSDTQIGSTANTQSGTSAGNNYALHTAIGAVLSGSAREIKLRITKVLSAPDLTYATGVLNYRLVG